MPIVLGTCRLCLADCVPLQSSHIIPAAIFNRLRPSTAEAKKFGLGGQVQISGGKAFSKSNDHKENLLCSACEANFCSTETEVLHLFANADRSFPLWDALGNYRPNFLGVHPCEVPRGVNAISLSRFALSVLWRASVSKAQPAFSKIALGHFEDRARRALFTSLDAWPDGTHLDVTIIDDNDGGTTQSSIIFPTQWQLRGGGLACIFLLCGVLFTFVLDDELIPDWHYFRSANAFGSTLGIAQPATFDLDLYFLNQTNAKPVGVFAAYVKNIQQRAFGIST